MTVAGLVLTCVGAYRLYRARPRFATYLGATALVHCLAVPILSPTFITSPLIFGRYLLPALVPILILLAAGVVGVGSDWNRHRRALAALAVLLLVTSGPLTNLRIYRYSLGLRPGIPNVAEERTADFVPPSGYETLSSGPAGKIVEFPARAGRRFARTLGDYQAVHGRQVVISPGEHALTDLRYALESVVAAEPEAILESGAAYLIVHRDWEAELGPLLGYTWPVAEAFLERARRQQPRLKLAASRLARRLVRAWGEPDTRTPLLWIWNLERVRTHLLTLTPRTDPV